MNDGLIDHVRLLLQYILTFVSQLRDYIPRLEFTRITQKISDEVTEVRSGLAEKFVMVVGKLTGLERRIENLETSGGGDSRARNEVHELKGKVRDLTVEIGNLRERNMSLEREMRDKMSIIDRLRSRMDQVDESLALNTVKITDMESQRAPVHNKRFIAIMVLCCGRLMAIRENDKMQSMELKQPYTVNPSIALSSGTKCVPRST